MEHAAEVHDMGRWIGLVTVQANEFRFEDGAVFRDSQADKRCRATARLQRANAKLKAAAEAEIEEESQLERILKGPRMAEVARRVRARLSREGEALAPGRA